MKLVRCYRSRNGFTESEIKDSDFFELQNARNTLRKVLDNESLFDQLIESYVDVKAAMYESSLKNLADNSEHDFLKSYSYRSKLNRLFFNTLNLSKLYLDKSFHSTKNTSFIKRLTKNNELHQLLSNFRDGISTKEYRLGCQMRNYVQHYALPVDGYTTGVRHNYRSDNSLSVFHVLLDKNKLKSSRNVTSEVLDLFENTIDFHDVMDGYIYAISQIHMYSRKLINEFVIRQKSFIEEKENEIIDAHHSSGCYIVNKETNDTYFHLGIKWFDVAEHLMNKNSHAINFKRFEHSPYKGD